jgi:arabinose-5-phosphate isomerase
MNKTKQEIRDILQKEAQAILQVAEKLDDSISEAVELIKNCKGKLVVTGMGKTGIIARKISATFASTGTPSIYLHPAEGIHGDLGMVAQDDVVMVVSNSGETREIIEIIPYFKSLKNKIISLTGNTKSRVAKASDVVIDISVPQEFEPLGLVPMACTTTALAVGNALATIVLQMKNFKEEDYAILHPGGSIGKRLLLQVKDIMHVKDENPVVDTSYKLKDAILVMTSKGLGCVSVVDEKGELTGIITDGDLRRILQKYENPLEMKIDTLMTKNPKRITPDTLGINALKLMEENAITMLPVIDEHHHPIGMLHMHDLIRAGIV